ncbi:hypothetical protein [Dokdonella sp.]|uniref:hypothetical protein n=1 Tax=Dokdonella sp. TaxID=2291710 RepID=UPI00352958FB
MNNSKHHGKRLKACARRLSLAAGLALALSASMADAEESPAPTGSANVHQQREAVAESEKIMGEAQRRNGLLAQYVFMRDAYANSNNFAFRVIFNQYLSWYQTWVGDYVGARNSFSIIQKQASDDAASPLKEAGWKPESAVDVIARLAKGRKAVFFNENHSYPLTRTLTVQMLKRLREEGFDTFASETLNQADMEALPGRGYAIDETGFYTLEPIYSEMVHEALKLGYRVVAYEALSNATADARESEQAHNLKRDVFKNHKDARLVVNAGYAHIQEHGKYLGGSSMAQHFERITGIDPLTVEQTMLIPHDKLASDHPYYRAVMETLAPTEPIVFVNDKGEPWSLKEKAYDVSVFFPEEVLQRNRPTWLALGGLRVPFAVSARMCDDAYPCMIEARYEGEPDAAIPADRLVVEFKGRTAGYGDKVRQSSDPYPIYELWLRPGRYQMLARNMDNQVRYRQTIEVKAAGKEK